MFQDIMMVGEVPSCENLLIFPHPERHLSKKAVRGRYLTEIKFKHVHNYVLFNYDGLRSFNKYNIKMLLFLNNFFYTFI